MNAEAACSRREEPHHPREESRGGFLRVRRSDTHKPHNRKPNGPPLERPSPFVRSTDRYAVRSGGLGVVNPRLVTTVCGEWLSWGGSCFAAAPPCAKCMHLDASVIRQLPSTSSRCAIDDTAAITIGVASKMGGTTCSCRKPAKAVALSLVAEAPFSHTSCRSGPSASDDLLPALAP